MLLITGELLLAGCVREWKVGIQQKLAEAAHIYMKNLLIDEIKIW